MRKFYEILLKECNVRKAIEKFHKEYLKKPWKKKKNWCTCAKKIWQK